MHGQQQLKQRRHLKILDVANVKPNSTTINAHQVRTGNEPQLLTNGIKSPVKIVDVILNPNFNKFKPISISLAWCYFYNRKNKESTCNL